MLPAACYIVGMVNDTNTAAGNRAGATSSEVPMSVSPAIVSSVLFGEFSRFRLDEFRTREGAVEWFVLDAERPDPETGLPSVIRQSASRELALAGLASQAVPAGRRPRGRRVRVK
jgi:hypothetical protein